MVSQESHNPATKKLDTGLKFYCFEVEGPRALEALGWICQMSFVCAYACAYGQWNYSVFVGTECERFR